MDELVTFLRARLAEVGPDPDVHTESCGYSRIEFCDDNYCECDVPTRVLADVDAKRQILGLVVDAGPEFGDGYTEACRDVVRLLALPHATHPDYRPEWRP